MTTKTESAAKAKSDVKPFVYVAVGVAALGGLLFGYDTGVISGAILFIKKQFSLSATMEEIVVSAVLVGAVIGAAAGGVLTNRFGRRKLIILAGIGNLPEPGRRSGRRRNLLVVRCHRSRRLDLLLSSGTGNQW